MEPRKVGDAVGAADVSLEVARRLADALAAEREHQRLLEQQRERLLNTHVSQLRERRLDHLLAARQQRQQQPRLPREHRLERRRADAALLKPRDRSHQHGRRVGRRRPIEALPLEPLERAAAEARPMSAGRSCETLAS